MSDGKVTAGDLVSLLRKRYEPQAGWLVFEQVSNGTGWKTQARYADALALQTYPSRGIEAEGFEVKVSRADLVAELRQPKKSEIQKWCERWWLVLPNEDIAKDLVLPSTWGVLVVRRGRLVPHIDAPRLDAEPWSPRFVAAVLRRFQDGLVPRRELDELSQRIDTEVDKRLEHEIASREPRAGAVESELRALQERVRKFERTSGVNIEHEWNCEEVGSAVAIVRNAVKRAASQHAIARAIETLREIEPWLTKAVSVLADVEAIAKSEKSEEAA